MGRILQLFTALLLSGLCLSLSAKDMKIVVAQDGSGDYQTLQQAVDACPDYFKHGEIQIEIRPGTYREKVIIPSSKQRLHLKGEDAATTIITWSDYALQNGPTGEPIGTSATPTVFFCGDDFLAENITFENAAGEGKEIAQACAVMVNADRVAFIGCRFVANQDTIYTFGKGQRQYWRDCWIEGTTDFIFGASTCWFENCTILSKRNSYVTAASTPEGARYGYVFNNCKLIHSEGVDKVYLGRPWRPYAKTVFIGCDLGDHIPPAGWHDWNKPYAHKTVFYAECDSRGPGAAKAGERVKWSHILKASRISEYTPENVLDCGTEIDKNGIAQPVKWFFKIF